MDTLIYYCLEAVCFCTSCKKHAFNKIKHTDISTGAVIVIKICDEA